MSSSPWKVCVSTKVQKLPEIMLEEYEKSHIIQDIEVGERKRNDVSTSYDGGDTSKFLKQISYSKDKNSECRSDTTIAKLLQYQFDKEYDDEITKLEKQSKNAKVSVSYINYRKTPSSSVKNFDFEEEDVEIADKKYWTYFETNDSKISSLIDGGDVIKDGEINSILDNINNGRKNAVCVTLIDPPKEHTVKDIRTHMKLPDIIQHIEQFHPQDFIRDLKGQQALLETCLDERTRHVLRELIHDKVVDVFDSIISIKKDYVILHGALRPNSWNCIEYAIKVYTVTSKDFQVCDKCKDCEFKDMSSNETNDKSESHKWAVTEKNKLVNMKYFYSCPRVQCLKENVLVMSFLGQNGKPAPKLDKVLLNTKQWQITYDLMKKGLRELYAREKMIHKNLTERSLLWWQERCRFTNAENFVPRDHPDGKKFLYQGCSNMDKFFKKQGVPNLKPDDLYKYVTKY